MEITTQQPTRSALARQIYDALMGARTSRDADACRAILRRLRAEHGDAAFEAAKVRAIVFDARANG